MKIFKNIKLVAAALLICAGFTACSEDEPVIPTTPTTPLRGEQGFYVINQGNMGVLDGTLDFSQQIAHAVKASSKLLTTRVWVTHHNVPCSMVQNSTSQCLPKTKYGCWMPTQLVYLLK